MTIRPCALFLLAGHSRTAAFLRLENLGFGLRLVQFLRGFLQRQTGRGAVHRLAGELVQIHFNVSCHDHQIRRRHFFRRNGITGAHGAAGFHFHPPAAFFSFAFNGFGCHKGMRHAGWASGDRHNAFLTRRFCRHGNRSRRLPGFRLGFGQCEEGFRFAYRQFHIAHINPFAVQRGVSRHCLPRHYHQFGLGRRLNQRQAGFRRSSAEHAFRQVATGLPQRIVYHQQRFHYASCYWLKGFRSTRAIIAANCGRSVTPTLLWLTASAATAVAKRRVCSLDSRISRP
ncbi:hypothetical protein D3C81_592780 [compost metagenome]